jgi:hypothetical protein
VIACSVVAVCFLCVCANASGAMNAQQARVTIVFIIMVSPVECYWVYSLRALDLHIACLDQNSSATTRTSSTYGNVTIIPETSAFPKMG